MEKSLRECCRSIRIGKMLIRHDDDDSSKPPKVKFDIPHKYFGELYNS